MRSGARLTAAEIEARLQEFGLNQMTARKRMSEWMRFLLQFHQPLIYILLAATAITGALGEWVDASVIFGVVLVNAVIGYLQEAKAEQAIDALAKMVVTEATVRRGGEKLRIPSAQLAPGDVVLLQSGDRVLPLREELHFPTRFFACAWHKPAPNSGPNGRECEPLRLPSDDGAARSNHRRPAARRNPARARRRALRSIR